jgi:hypothetical protein
MRHGGLTLTVSWIVLLFICLPSVSRAESQAATDMSFDISSVDSAHKSVFELCFTPDPNDPAKISSKATMCSALLSALKTGADQTTGTLKDLYALRRTQLVDSREDSRERDEKNWGVTWFGFLIGVDVISVILAVAVFWCVARASDTQGLLRERGPSSGGAGKLSFSRVIGVTGGLTTFLFVVLLTNIALSHLFLTGKMPDQFGSIYASAVGTLLTVLVPYMVNQISTPRGPVPPA